MFWENIVSDINLSGKKIVKKDIIKTKYFNIVMVYLGKNQEIPPHPEPYAVFFFVLQGRGKFTKKDELYMLHKDSCIFFESNEIRGIKSHEDLILLGIQEPH